MRVRNQGNVLPSQAIQAQKAERQCPNVTSGLRLQQVNYTSSSTEAYRGVWGSRGDNHGFEGMRWEWGDRSS